MEKYQVVFPGSSSSAALSSSSSAAIFSSNTTNSRAFTSIGHHNKEHRYAFQTRSQIDVLDDGYKWRKYGQKLVKNNKFPRSYYRCTHEGCNVKKQVQRLSKDEAIVMTTYEGMHIHPIHHGSSFRTWNIY